MAPPPQGIRSQTPKGPSDSMHCTAASLQMRTGPEEAKSESQPRVAAQARSPSPILIGRRIRSAPRTRLARLFERLTLVVGTAKVAWRKSTKKSRSPESGRFGARRCLNPFSRVAASAQASYQVQIDAPLESHGLLPLRAMPQGLRRGVHHQRERRGRELRIPGG